MSNYKEQSKLQQKELYPGFSARLVHTEDVTITYVDIDQGAELPEHKHVHAQVTSLLAGECEMTVGNETRKMKAGDVFVIPSNVLHSLKAYTACKVVDVFTPPREDYR